LTRTRKEKNVCPTSKRMADQRKNCSHRDPRRGGSRGDRKASLLVIHPGRWGERKDRLMETIHQRTTKGKITFQLRRTQSMLLATDTVCAFGGQQKRGGGGGKKKKKKNDKSVPK